ncbi:MAG: T9SS type A sorting domain-containing protein [Saprospiraceae bacterium]|nr:T9SS type A sorting domain-containing protein [Saprospiraceae bacterium]
MKKILLIVIILWNDIQAQEQINVDFNTWYQDIDGFGAFQGGEMTTQAWWQNLYIHDLECSIYRVDLTPRLKSPYSDLSYYSPWFMGSQTKSVFNYEDPANPNGPENNRVRTYTGPRDYSRTFGGRNAPIAVMGPNIESNLNYFNYPVDGAISEMIKNKAKLGDVKIIGSIWSPLPWVKVSSGNTYPENWWPGPVVGTRWPFIWGGNFAGGRLDVSGTKYNEFNDASLGGSGNTDAVTQFARSSAAYILGYQRNFNFKFYAISIQNELNFEQFYNSLTYPLSSQYITAIKAIKAEFSKHVELKDILIMGPEDLLGGDAYGMWEYGGPVHKNLQYLSNIVKDPEALNALDFLCIHGYANDGVSSAGSNPRLWDWWVNGWTTSPAPGIPANVKGFSSLRKKSWMTETSGEHRDWLFPKNAYPNNGGWSLALKIHQALTTGMESAWIHWTFVDSNSDGTVSNFGITNQTSGLSSPKYNAIKHYYKFIKPNSRRNNVVTQNNARVLCSSYYNNKDGNLTLVLVNTASANTDIIVQVPEKGKTIPMNDYLSSENNYFVRSTKNFVNGNMNLSMPAYSVRTIHGKYDLISAIEEEITEDLRINYNSEMNALIINNNLNSEITNIRLFNVAGQELELNQDFNDSMISLPGLHSGLHFVQYYAEGKKYIYKFIIP